MKRRLYEQPEDKISKVTNGFNTLLYIIESNIKNSNINSLSIGKVRYFEKYNQLEASLTINAWCEDPDVGAFTHILNSIDTDIYNIIRNYDFNKEGILVKSPESGNLMFLFDSCRWSAIGDAELIITYHIAQDEYR
jgi:hypothetical protein